jgi:hypothetical protein
LPDEAVDHRQAEPRSLPERLGGEERIEGARDDVGRHAGARVGDAQRDILPRRQFADARGAVVKPLVGGLDRDPSPSGIASRALMHRLSKAFSGWLGSTCARISAAILLSPEEVKDRAAGG